MDVEHDPQTSPSPSHRSGVLSRRTLIGTAVAAVLIAGALVIRPAEPDAPWTVKPEERALAAVGAGAPAAIEDLTALIGDRERWLRKNPKDSRSWAVLGSAYLEQARRTADSANYPRAERALQRSLQAKPMEKGNVEATVGMGALANARHDYRTAQRWGELARAQSPRHWAAYPVLIDAYSGLGRPKDSEKAMEKLVALRPGTVAYIRVAQVYWDRGWREDAGAALTKATGAARTPAERADCMYRLGEMAWERGEAAEALHHFESALRIDPEHHQALGGRARALAGLGRSGEAVHDYRAALGHAPVPRYALELGELLESMGRVAQAQGPYDLLRAQIARAGSHGVSDELTLGLFESDHGDATAAVRRLSEEWKRHKNMRVADALGWALHRKGDDEQALVFAKKAADPGLRSADFSYHRGEIERALGLPGAARRRLDEALRTNPHFSPLRAPLARAALAALGEPPPGGPVELEGEGADGATPKPAAPQPGAGGRPEQPQSPPQQPPPPQQQPQSPPQSPQAPPQPPPQPQQPRQPQTPPPAQPPSGGAAGQSSPAAPRQGAPGAPGAPVEPAPQQPPAWTSPGT
ncbi:tetratricopeptide repeat protein [Streptomyces sp. SYSU K21746]